VGLAGHAFGAGRVEVFDGLVFRPGIGHRRGRPDERRRGEQGGDEDEAEAGPAWIFDMPG